jgi:hypothetical protein
LSIVNNTATAERNDDANTSNRHSCEHYNQRTDPGHSSKGDIPGNGLIEAGAIIRIGRKVLIDEACFFEWVESQQGTR